MAGTTVLALGLLQSYTNYYTALYCKMICYFVKFHGLGAGIGKIRFRKNWSGGKQEFNKKKGMGIGIESKDIERIRID